MWFNRFALPVGIVAAMVIYSAAYGNLFQALLGSAACACLGAVAGALGGAIPGRPGWGAADGACLGAVIGAGPGARMGLEWIDWRMAASIFLLTGFFGLCMAEPPSAPPPDPQREA